MIDKEMQQHHALNGNDGHGLSWMVRLSVCHFVHGLAYGNPFYKLKTWGYVVYPLVEDHFSNLIKGYIDSFFNGCCAP